MALGSANNDKADRKPFETVKLVLDLFSNMLNIMKAGLYKVPYPPS